MQTTNSKRLTVALVGNPNCGKTSLFNTLTGTQQRVGNWPGVTVERKTGEFEVTAQQAVQKVQLVDLPGTYSLGSASGADQEHLATDERIARDYLETDEPDLILNLLDASSLSRGLYLTNELLNLGKPMIVALNMMDVAEHQGIDIDIDGLAEQLGCPVVPVVASQGQGLDALRELLHPTHQPSAQRPISPAGADDTTGYAAIDKLLASVVKHNTPEDKPTISQRIDDLVLHRLFAFPIFLGVMYLMFLFSVNVGSAFIDFFDLTVSALVVELPKQLLSAIGTPAWLVTLLTDGIGGGIALVATFIPVIGCLFLALSFLEDSGYMGRIAFIVDRLLRRLGLPGKSFVPLIVGFGCNVPAVMATRTLEREPDRILTTIMAPYMSCGARLTVYALFAAAFFPSNGQNVVFALYLFGIVVAVLSALVVRKHLIAEPAGTFVMELPDYHWPRAKNLLLQTWQRLQGFVVRAGKAIVAVVVVLNVLNSWGTDGSFGNENSQVSVLSEIGRTITPAFGPMGIQEDNWPATVGIFTGIFAKEVVVGTLDALYSQTSSEGQSVPEMLRAGLASIPANLGDLGGALLDPLGISVGELDDLETAAAEQEVTLSTMGQMQLLFDGRIGAFSYLLFILLYMPCVATIGVVYKEIGAFWAVFSTGWSIVLAYSCAVICYQVGTFSQHPASSALWLVGIAIGAVLCFVALIAFGRRRQYRLIPTVQLD